MSWNDLSGGGIWLPRPRKTRHNNRCTPRASLKQDRTLTIVLNSFPLVVIHENTHLSHCSRPLEGQTRHQHQTSCPRDSQRTSPNTGPVWKQLVITMMGLNRHVPMRHPDRCKSYWRGVGGSSFSLHSGLCERCAGVASSIVSFNLFSIHLPLSSEYKCTSRPDDNGHQIQRHWQVQRRTCVVLCSREGAGPSLN